MQVLTARFSKILGFADKLAQGGIENIAKVFIGTATLNATTQAFEMAIGVQHKFDIKLVIEQSIASVIAGLSHTLSDKNVFTHVLSPVTNDVINAGMGVAFGYPVDTEQLAADMLADEAVDTACDALSSVTPAAQKTSIDQTKILEPVHFSDQSLNEESHEIDQLMHSDAGLVDHMGDDFLGTYENTLTTGIRAINAATAFSLKPDVQRQRQIRTSTSSAPHFFGGALKTAENAVKFGYGFALGAGHAVGDMTYEAMNALEHPARTAMAMYAMGQSADEKLMHFAQALMDPDTRPTTISDAKNTAKFAGVALFSKLKSLDAEGRGEAIGDVATEAASFLMPGAGEARVATNAADALRLKTILALQDTGILDISGKLTKTAINGADIAMRKDSVLRNPSVISDLTKDGSKITDWRKMTTDSIEIHTGQSVQIHFYQNKITGEINYTHSDFKVKGKIDALYTRNVESTQKIFKK